MHRPERVRRLYLDFDSFYASAEQHLRPELRGRPVGVVPIDSPHTCLIAASREAKPYGLGVGTPVREARAVPDLALVVARPDAYVRLHREILAVVGEVLPVGAVRSIDEVSCALMRNEAARALDLAREIKAGLARAFSPALTCSIGLAPNELLAKLAAEMEKPDGLVRLAPEDLPGRLLGLPLKAVPGISHRLAARLERAGVRDMAALWALPRKQARAIWGSVEGERLWAGLHGHAVEAPPKRRGMFGHGRVLPRDWRRPDKARLCLRWLLVKAARRMRREGYAAGGLLAWVRGEGDEAWAADVKFPRPARDDLALLAALDRLLARAGIEGAPTRPKSVNVTLFDLAPADDPADDLAEPPEEAAARRRRERLTAVLDGLAHHGRAAPCFGGRVDLPGGYAGAKIAFDRVPDDLDFA